MLSCSKDDESSTCETKVFGFQIETDTQTSVTQYRLFIGETVGNDELVTVNIKTFNYYKNKSNNFIKVVCYNGLK